MKRALFLKTKHLGDSVVLTAAIEALPADWTVDVLCFPESREIFLMHPRVGEIFLTSRGLTGLARLRAYWQTFWRMRAHSYDLLVQFSDDWRGAWLSRLLRAKSSVVRASNKRPGFWHRSFDITVPYVVDQHVAQSDVDLIRATGLYEKTAAPAYCLIPNSSASERVAQFLQGSSLQKNNFLIIHACARWKFKGLPDATWQQVITDLLNRGYRLVLSGSAMDFADNRRIAGPYLDRVIIPADFSIQDTAALYGMGKFLVSIDSLSIHLAAAVGLPVVAIFGPSGEFNWHPWQVRYQVIAQTERYPCRPCGRDGCNGSKRSECLETLPVDQIVRTVVDFDRLLLAVS